MKTGKKQSRWPLVDLLFVLLSWFLALSVVFMIIEKLAVFLKHKY